MADAREFAAEVFRSVDLKDVKQFVAYLSDDAAFVFGNSELVSGRTAIFRYVEGFLATVQEVRHDLFDVWQIDDAIIIRLSVTYTRHDKVKLSYPCVTVWRMKNDRIADYRIYVDNSGLFCDQEKTA